MGVQERRDREKAELRQLIIDTARELFARQGYEAVSMRKIADAIEYSPTAIYLYFSDKRELFDEICREDFSALARSVDRIDQIEDPLERIRRIGLAYIAFGISQPNHYRLMFMTSRESTETMPRTDPAREAYEVIRRAMLNAIERRALREELKDAEMLAQSFWAAIHGLVALEISMGKSTLVQWRVFEARSKLVIDALLRGLCEDDPIDRSAGDEMKRTVKNSSKNSSKKTMRKQTTLARGPA